MELEAGVGGGAKKARLRGIASYEVSANQSARWSLLFMVQ